MLPHCHARPMANLLSEVQLALDDGVDVLPAHVV